MTERLLIAALATWRLTELLLKEEGFLHIGRAWRTLTSRIAAINKLGFCDKCLSVWVGAVCAVLILTDFWVLLVPFALSVVVMVINGILDRTTGN